ncbi:MAG: thioredoxin family protein [Opitutaceae bacterium]|nr:thioredoxin family protein [Opitutaceae bacterium]
MKKILILGPGCKRCQLLAETARIAADQLQLSCEIEKVTDINRFAEFGIMFTPALVVDGVVKIAGKVPGIEEVKKLLV